MMICDESVTRGEYGPANCGGHYSSLPVKVLPHAPRRAVLASYPPRPHGRRAAAEGNARRPSKDRAHRDHRAMTWLSGGQGRFTYGEQDPAEEAGQDIFPQGPRRDAVAAQARGSGEEPDVGPFNPQAPRRVRRPPCGGDPPAHRRKAGRRPGQTNGATAGAQGVPPTRPPRGQAGGARAADHAGHIDSRPSPDRTRTDYARAPDVGS